jgi:hypothetical protein
LLVSVVALWAKRLEIVWVEEKFGMLLGSLDVVAVRRAGDGPAELALVSISGEDAQSQSLPLGRVAHLLYHFAFHLDLG